MECIYIDCASRGLRHQVGGGGDSRASRAESTGCLQGGGSGRQGGGHRGCPSGRQGREGATTHPGEVWFPQEES